MRKLILGFMLLVGFVSFVPVAQAAESWGDLALWPTIQLFPATDDVKGVRLALYGVKQNFTGLDLGFVKVVEGDFVGAALWGGNKVKGNAKGLQAGFVNYVENNFTGAQLGLANYSFGETTGFQGGIYNRGGHFVGLQLGFVNRARSLGGLQIGLLNFHDEGDQSKFPKEAAFFPFVNWKF